VIAHLSGTLREKQIQRLVVDVGGVGYDVQVPLSTFYEVGEPGAAVSLRIHTHVREDALLLFGFSTALELELFNKLLAVSGIGPKVALGVLSGIEPLELVRAIRQSDLARLTSIPGVGKKTAERIVIELRDRLPKSTVDPETAAADAADDVRADLLSALGNLGYSRGTVDRVVDKVLKAAATREFEPLLRDVLKELTR
jgi:Holliday junction DNA helicase RuvA